MYSPTAEVIADAFDLGEPIGELIFVRRGDTDTWRLDTVSGSYLVKGYWPTTGGQFTAGGLPDQLEVAMAFEARALEAGIDMPWPISPLNPLLGWVTRLNDRLFRVYRWIEHREFRPDDDICDWLGRTMALVHQLQPLEQVGLPDWWRAAIRPQSSWEDWFAEAERRTKSWSGLGAECLPAILEISERIAAVCWIAPDCVMTHGDFKTHNLLKTSTGQALVDWDSVRVDSAALEAGRVAYLFGRPEAILQAYVGAGGNISWAGRDLFLSESRHDVQVLFERIMVSLEQVPAPRWMEDGQALDRKIGGLLRELPGKTARLDELAVENLRTCGGEAG